MRLLHAYGLATALVVTIVACAGTAHPAGKNGAHQVSFDLAQVPTWSAADLEYFLHGSMGTEVVPERVLTAFRAVYPDLFPGQDLAAFGLITGAGDLPVGMTRRPVPHLGSLPSLGINCAACHTTEVQPQDGAPPVRLLGTTGHFDAEAFFGAVTAAELRTADPTNMAAFLRASLRAADPGGANAALPKLDAALAQQKDEIAKAIAADPAGSKGIGPGELHKLTAADLAIDRTGVEAGPDLAALARAHLRLFHNMRVALHIPDQLPAALPPASGPGRNDAFGLLAASLFQAPTDYAPVKYGLCWNAGARPWVHWDANTRSPLGRNILAALGLGAPLLGRRAVLDLALVQRQTTLTDVIQPPRWPWAVDRDAASRGARVYNENCAQCHNGPETDARLCEPARIGTDPRRASGFDAAHAELFDQFFQELQLEGFTAPAEPPIRSTGKYLAPGLAGVWARSPYLHNGAVRTLAELLAPPSMRSRTFHRGSRVYDREQLGFVDDGTYVLDTTTPGNGNGGHDYGTALATAERRDLLEFLKTL